MALHFATASRIDEARDGVVWCIDFIEAKTRLPRRLRAILDREHSSAFTLETLSRFETLRDFDTVSTQPFLAFVEPPSVDVRILNQFALFSVMSSPAAQLTTWMRRDRHLVKRVTIPARLKWEIRDKVDQANITERTLSRSRRPESMAGAVLSAPRPTHGRTLNAVVERGVPRGRPSTVLFRPGQTGIQCRCTPA